MRKRISGNLFLAFLTLTWCLEGANDFRITHRINAHGDEPMALAQSADGRRLVIGTEKGEVLVWDIAERRLINRLDQGEPVHAVAVADAPGFIFAAGGRHLGVRRSGLVRRWNLNAGTYTDLQPASSSSILSLATDPASGIVAASNMTGELFVWDARGRLLVSRRWNESILGLAIQGRSILLTTVDLNALQRAAMNQEFATNAVTELDLDNPEAPPRQVVPRQEGRFWSSANPSPDGKWIAVQGNERTGRFVILFERTEGQRVVREAGKFPNRSAALWSADGSLVLLAAEVPAEIIRISADGKLEKTDLLAAGNWHRSGSPADLRGAVISPDKTRVWMLFRLGSALAECSIVKKSCEIIYQVPPFAYAMHAQERDDGLLATAGDEGLVKVWRRQDFSLVREFPASPGVPQGVAIMDDARSIVFSSSKSDTPSEIFSGDLTTGVASRLLTVPQPFVTVRYAQNGFVYSHGSRLLLANPANGETIREFPADAKVALMATSPNGKWLAAADDHRALYCFDLTTGQRLAKQEQPPPKQPQGKAEEFTYTALAIPNDGKSVFAATDRGTLLQWRPAARSQRTLTGIRGTARSLFVTGDGSRVAVGGNHRDAAVYDAASGDGIFYTQLADADFYVTNVWLSGPTFILTTDAGILFAGTLK
jgi:WD40 repeat protein